MAEQTAEYYASFDAETPYFTKPVGSSVQPPAPTPPDNKEFVKFVPSESGMWNGISKASISFVLPDGSDSDSDPEEMSLELESDGNPVCDDNTGGLLKDTWVPKLPSDYVVSVVFYDYMTFLVTLKIDEVEYTGSGAIENGDTELTLKTEDGTSSVPATVSLEAISLSSAPTLKYYAVYQPVPVPSYTITFRWYSGSGDLVQQSQSYNEGAGIDFPTETPTLDGWTGGWYQGETPVVEPVYATANATYEYLLQPAATTSLPIDWGIDPNPDPQTVSGFKWGHDYPGLSASVPKREGLVLQGLYLVYGVGGSIDEDSPRCYNSNGAPCARVTVDITENGYSLVAKWVPSSAVHSDLASLRSAVGIIPSPFAAVPSAVCTIADSSTSDESVNFTTGFPPIYSDPIEEGGKVITRQMVNALGNLGSQEQFLAQCGGYHTFDPAYAAAVEGYPKNAILHLVDSATGAFRTVRSLKDDNKINFLEVGVDGVNWAYADANPIVSIDVDYSDYEDLSERLFTEVGVPDLYEVPFDSYLQAFAVGSLDCESLRCAEWENQKFNAWEDGDPTREYTIEVNGMYYSYGTGTSYLDIYHRDSQSFGSVVIGGFFPFEVLYMNNAMNFYHASKICPLSPFSCGVFLSAGDKIRVRNTVAEKDGAVNLPSFSRNFTQPMVHTDETLRRKYNYRFAALFRRGVAL